MKKTQLVISSILFACVMHSQISFTFQPMAGYSLAAKENLIPTKLFGGASTSLALGTNNIMYSFGAGLLRMQTENPFFKKQKFQYIALGANYRLISTYPQFYLGVSALNARTVLKPRKSSFKDGLYPTEISTWSQWGYQVSTYVYFKKSLGICISYIRLIAHSYDLQNYQSLITIGLSIRGLTNKPSDAK